MNKTVSINLAGQVFQIDELAYERLWKYLEAIKQRYANTKGGADIISDIESRFAEMFYEALGTARKVVSMADVEQVITIMGQPEEFEATLGDDDDPIYNATGGANTASGEKIQRRLFRNPDDKVIGGVASGLSAYFGIADPIWMRLLFLFTFWAFGSGFLLYLVLMVLVPKAQTASEKLQMRGAPINIDNIEKTIREELNDLENRLNNAAGRGDRARGVLSKLVDFIATVLRLVFKVLGKFIGFLFALLGIVLLMGLVLGISIPSMVEGGFSFHMLSHLFTSDGHIVAAVLGFGLLVFIPCMFLLYSGVAILLNRRISFRGIGLTSIGLALVGIILVVYTVSNVHAQTNVTRKHYESITLAPPIDGIMRIELFKDERNEDNFEGVLWSDGDFREQGDTLLAQNITFTIVKASGTEYLLEKTISASGIDSDAAHERANHIKYNIAQDSARLYLPRFFAFPALDKIREQEINLVLHVPEGGSVFLNGNVVALIDDIKNVTNTYDGHMVNHTWKMMPPGLTCLDCGDRTLSANYSGSTGTAAPAAPIAPSVPSQPSSAVEETLQPFTTIDVDGAVNFYLIPSSESRIVYEDDDAKDGLDVSISGQRLTVTSRKDWAIFRKQVQVWVYTAEIEKVIITGHSKGQIGGFSTPNLHVEAAGASECRLSVGAAKLTLRISGASNMEVEGTAIELDAEAAGASELEAFKLVATNARVHTSGASSAEVLVQNDLHAESNGASSIDYKGSPKVSSSTSGSSSINPKP
ncbi:hypothetical protein BH09BAC1_BH09BAC1_04420 [soil metagenome]